MARTRLGSGRSRMRTARAGRDRRWLAGAIAVICALLLPGAAAAAEPPFRVPTQITDRAGALSGSDQADVQAALDKLSSEDNINLFVVYVENFDDPSGGQAWGEQTYLASDLGANDMLLSIATVGRDYSVRVPPNFKLSTSQLDQVAENEIRPQLVDGDWAGAAIAAANGYREALGGSSSTWWWVAGGIVVVGGGGYLIYRRSRRKTDDRRRAGGRPGRAAAGTAGAAGPAVRPQRAGPDRHRQCRPGQRIRAQRRGIRVRPRRRRAVPHRLRRRPRIADRGLRDPAAGRRRGAGGRRDQAGDDDRDPHPMRRRRRQTRGGERPVRRTARPALPAAAGAGRAAGQHRRAAGPHTGGRQRRCCGCSSSTHRPRWRTSRRTSTAGHRAAGVRRQQCHGRHSNWSAAGTGGPTATQPTAGGQPAAVTGTTRAPPPSSPPAPRRRPSPRRRPCWTPSNTPTPTWPRRSASSAPPAPRWIRNSPRCAGTLSCRAGRGHREQPAGAAGSDPGDPGCRPVTAGRGRPADRPAQGGGGRSGAGHDPRRDPGRPAAGAAGPGRLRPGAVGRAGRGRLGAGLHHDPARGGREPGPHPAGGGAAPSGQRRVDGAGSNAAAGLAEAQQAASLAREASDLAQQDVGGWGGGGGGQRGGGLNGAMLGGIILSSVLNSGRSGRGGGGWGGGGFGGGGSAAVRVAAAAVAAV